MAKEVNISMIIQDKLYDEEAMKMIQANPDTKQKVKDLLKNIKKNRQGQKQYYVKKRVILEDV